MTHNNTFGLILDIVYETMPRDNLLNSACLELFEFIKRENIKSIVLHIVEKYGEKLNNITYVDTFRDLVIRYEQMQGYGAEVDSTLFSQDDGASARRMQANGQRWQGVKEMDAAEEEYFNTSDDEDEVHCSTMHHSSIPFLLTPAFSGNSKIPPRFQRWLPRHKMAAFPQWLSHWSTTRTTTTTTTIPWIPKQNRALDNSSRSKKTLTLHTSTRNLSRPQCR